jgi:hypothetical protein
MTCALQWGLDGNDVVLQDVLLEVLEVVCAAGSHHCCAIQTCSSCALGRSGRFDRVQNPDTQAALWLWMPCLESQCIIRTLLQVGLQRLAGLPLPVAHHCEVIQQGCSSRRHVTSVCRRGSGKCQPCTAEEASNYWKGLRAPALHGCLLLGLQHQHTAAMADRLTLGELQDDQAILVLRLLGKVLHAALEVLLQEDWHMRTVSSSRLISRMQD